MAGCEVVAAVEWESHAAECYRLNHPDTVVIEGDIAKVSGADILNATGLDVGEIDILDGSPPCQGFSTAGSRVLDDPRNDLFRQHLRLVRELEPKHVVIENVAGMVRGKMRAVAAEVIIELKSMGYQVTAGLLAAQYFGVAQLRPRVFFIASRIGQPQLPKPTTMPIPCGVALRGIDPGEIPKLTAASARLLAHHLRPGEYGSKMLARLGRAAGRDDVVYKGEVKKSWFSAVMLHPNKPSPTISKSNAAAPTGKLFHWQRREVTVREALVLTGFPADYNLTGSHAKRWARVGNAVAPPMTREIALQSLAPLGGS
jgi:DNA (cytosine-5)-methyltransferase 1